MSTAEKIRLPDDCTIGYIIESVLGVKLIRSNLFHSHLENLHQVPKTEIHKQVSLSRCPGADGGVGVDGNVTAFHVVT